MKPVFQHITVPVDGSTTSERGVAFALELARDGGRVSFCSVVDPMLVCTPAAYGASIDPAPMLGVLDDDAATFCRSASERAGKAGVAADTTVLHGACVAQIDDFAERNGSDAIVIGTNGRTGFSRAVLGSVTEGILRRATMPVVAVHRDDQMRTGPLAVAIDDSPAARAALDVAIGIAAARGIPILLLHACGAKSDTAAVNAMLDRARERARLRGVIAQTVVHEGPAAETLAHEAEERDCCMVVIGTHGRSELRRLLLGSVAAAVLERAHVPVVTVRCAA
ncbi:MAG TPA: universal stress protein [Candidatus Limnocylindrales bacterium]|nr:universal stress protein [Candidatus Limnocylindrales bacterium]